MSFTLHITPEAKTQLTSIMEDESRIGLQKQLKKALKMLSLDPRYPALNSHPLQDSEAILGVKVWTSYVQNKTPAAHRILWAYGKTKNEIIILQIVPHY